MIFPCRKLAYGCTVITFILGLFLSLLSSAFGQQNAWDELNARVDSLYGQGKYAEAVPAAQQLVDFAEEKFGAKAPNVASSLNKLAVLYEEVGNFADAEPKRCLLPIVPKWPRA